MTWLPGDPRGFRNRDHRIHSSGDYKDPPPDGEHEGLHRYAKRVSKDEVVLRTPELRREVCDALLRTTRTLDLRMVVITVCRVHVHLVIELPETRDDHEVTLRDLKGKPAPRLWARKWKVVPIVDAAHREDEIAYVRDRQGRYATTWTHRDGWLRVA